MSGNKYEFMYFPVKGYGNMVRIVLEDQGIPYEYKPVGENWPQVKPTTPFGQVPVLTVNGSTQIAQSHTIARYLGREHGLMGSNNIEQAQIEMWIDQSADLRKKFAKMIYTDYENGLKPFLESIPTELAPFEKQLTGDSAHLLFGKLTLADYIVFDVLHVLTALSPTCLDSSPHVKAFYTSFAAMSSNTYELTYFPVKGLGNMIRLILEDQSIKYKFNLITKDTWADFKPTTPFGQLPVLTINGKTKISQSHTIARYLGREHGLMGSNNIEQAQIEMWIDQTIDIRTKFLRMIYENYEAGKQPFIDSIPAQLEPFEKQLTGDSAHLLFGKLTLADYIVFDVLLVLTALSPTCLDSSPHVKAFYTSFGARKNLHAFLEKPEIKSMKFTGSMHHIK
uniref:glutathione transferase n=1 Tax=Macrostomum lignano TaxID=282301 RepID=A0A1I8I5G0_9PLAT